MIFTGVFLLACTFETDAECEGKVLVLSENEKLASNVINSRSHQQEDFPCQVNEVWTVLHPI